MAKVKFTVGRLAAFACPEGKAQAFLWDAEVPGLGLRVTAGGAKSFVFQRPIGGVEARITLGRLETLRLPEAREGARKLQRLIDDGRDPRVVKTESLATDAATRRADATAAITVGQAWAHYLRDGKPRKKAAWKPRYRLDLIAASALGGEPKKRGQGVMQPGHLAPLMALPLASLDRKAARAWMREEAKRSNVQAARAAAMFSAFLAWTANQPEYEGLVADVRCFRASELGDMVTTPPPRTDKLEGSHLPAFFAALGRLRERQSHAAAYLVCALLTGARREELAALRWDAVDDRWKRLTIADKIAASRVIPLAPYVDATLQTLAREEGNPYVFVGTAGRIREPRAYLDAVVADAGLPHLTIHGLRRSFATLGEEAGAPAGALAQIMGHRPSAIAERYKPRSMDALAAILVRVEDYIVARAAKPEKGGSVVPMKAA